MVNIASTKMMKKFATACDAFLSAALRVPYPHGRKMAGELPAISVSVDAVAVPQAWLATALPRAACAAASRAIGTRYGLQLT